MKVPPPSSTEQNRTAAWWSDFFNDLWIEVQRRSKSAEQSAREAAFICRALRLEKGARVLDVPCGVGRIAVELAALGHVVTGIDLTGDFIEDARRTAAGRGLDIQFMRGDMRELPARPEFDAVVCWWGSFGYFEDAENAAFLRAAARCLKPGGRILIDTHVMETLLPGMRERAWRRIGDILVLEERRYDFESSRTLTDWTFIRDGSVYSNQTSIRLYSYGELTRMLADAGFDRFNAYGSIEEDPFQAGSDRLYLVART